MTVFSERAILGEIFHHILTHGYTATVCDRVVSVFRPGGAAVLRVRLGSGQELIEDVDGDQNLYAELLEVAQNAVD